MSDLPEKIELVEEGPREGAQSEPGGIPLAAKIKLIDGLAEAGLREINCCSFVSPKRVPQMADAEAIADGISRRAGVRYTGLWLNDQGFERARQTPLDLVGNLVASASAAFGRNNNNRSPQELLAQQRGMAELYRQAGVPFGSAYVFTAFGCTFEGDISVQKVVQAMAGLLEIFADHGQAPEALYLCDTVGWATPLQIERAVGALRDRWPEHPIALHLHDTRGAGLANAMAGLRLGVRRFDASCAGLGGCPFSGEGAAGNICTEDLVFLCEESGVATGVNLDALIDCARYIEGVVGHSLPGKTMKAGSLSRFRA